MMDNESEQAMKVMVDITLSAPELRALLRAAGVVVPKGARKPELISLAVENIDLMGLPDP